MNYLLPNNRRLN